MTVRYRGQVRDEERHRDYICISESLEKDCLVCIIYRKRCVNSVCGVEWMTLALSQAIIGSSPSGISSNTPRDNKNTVTDI